MPKKVKEAKAEESNDTLQTPPRFYQKTMDELFWDAKGFKQCLWTVLEDNKFKPLTEKQMEATWKEFNRIEAFTMSKYGPAIDALEGKKEKKVETVSKSSKDVNKILNAPNLKKLKRIWKKIAINEGDYTAEEFEHLTEIKDKRKDDLIKENSEE